MPLHAANPMLSFLHFTRVSIKASTKASINRKSPRPIWDESCISRGTTQFPTCIHIDRRLHCDRYVADQAFVNGNDAPTAYGRACFSQLNHSLTISSSRTMFGRVSIPVPSNTGSLKWHLCLLIRSSEISISNYVHPTTTLKYKSGTVPLSRTLRRNLVYSSRVKWMALGDSLHRQPCALHRPMDFQCFHRISGTCRIEAARRRFER